MHPLEATQLRTGPLHVLPSVSSWGGEHTKMRVLETVANAHGKKLEE